MARKRLLVDLIFASANPGKLAEVSLILRGLPVRFFSLADLPGFPEVVEDGVTFEANAEKKARAAFAFSKKWSLADDSGLMVDALGGRPGVHSARYAGPPRSDQRNNEKLLAELAGMPDERRTARFVCVMALATATGVFTTRGEWEGRIAHEPRGQNGFGFDPLFFVPALGCTAADLARERKNSLSHRGQALTKMRVVIERLLKEGGGG